MKYYIELSERGMNVFKGGNIEVMIKPLLKSPFEAKNKAKAEDFLYMVLNETIGTGSLYLYTIREVIK